MATRTIWEDLYSVASGVTNISTAANGAFGIPLTNHPSFNPGTQTINTRKAVGTSYRQTGTGCLEYTQGSAIPTTSFEFDVSSKNLSHFLWSLFQTGSFQAGAPTYIKYYVPYETPDVEMWLTLIRKLAPNATSSSHRIVGAIVKSISLSCEEGQNLKAVVEFQGYSFESNRNTADDTFTFQTASCLQMQNATITLDGTTVYVPSFSLNITNNALTKFYDNSTAVRHDVGEFSVTGNIRIPWAQATEGANQQIDDFCNGSASRLVIYWGDSELANADTEFTIISHIRRTAVSVEGEDEIISSVDFECASEESSSSVTTALASTIAVSAGTVTGTNTVFSNFNVGDLLYPLGNWANAGDETIRVITAIASNTSMTVFPVFTGTDSGKYYRIRSTPITFSVCDATNITGM